MQTNQIKSDHSFAWYNATQFFGALNDNIFKLLVVYYLIGAGTAKRATLVQPVAQALTVIPFIVLLAYAGRLADRHSKRNLIIFCKAAELVVMAGAVIAFWSQMHIILGVVLLLMYTQSTFFSPNKYGIICELVPAEQVRSANGKVQAFTYMAILLGVVTAPKLKDLVGGHYISAAFVCVLIAAAGLITSLFIKPTHSAGGSGKASVLFIRDIVKTLWSIHRKKVLIWSVIGSAYFTFVGVSMYFCVIPYGMHFLDLTKENSTYLFVFALIGITCGSLLAGRYRRKSGKGIMIPSGTFLLGLSALAIGIIHPDIVLSGLLLFLMGIGAGMFVVPVNTLVQTQSPLHRRGEIIAASQFLSWVSNLVAIVIFLILTQILKFNPAHLFISSGAIALSVGITLICQSSKKQQDF